MTAAPDAGGPAAYGDPPPTGWRLSDAAIAIGSGVAISGLAASLLASGGLSGMEIFAIVLPAQSLTTLALVGLIGRLKRRTWTSPTPTAHWGDLVGVPIGVGVQVVLATLALTVVETFFNGEVPGQEVIDVAGSTAGSIERMLAVFGLVVLGPLAEEVVFRGMVLPALMPRGRRFAVVASSAAFALLHLLDPRAVFAVPFLFILSVVIANETIRTGRLGRAVAIHAGFNLVTVIAVFVT